MSAGKSDTSSKRKKSTPQKFKSRKLFAGSRNDILEQPEFSRARDGEDQENVSKLPGTLQNKENLPEEWPNGSATVHRGRGRPKGSKNKTFPTSTARVYDVREAKSPVDNVKLEDDGDNRPENGVATPHRGRGRPKGSTKVMRVNQEGEIGLKRSRGRPKGSKNKKPSKKRLSSGQKIGRGRPRKILSVDAPLTPKRGRGRPKGSLKKVPSAERFPVFSGTREVKKRGRPRKIVLHTTLMPLSPKSPRGRPRIKALTPLPEPVDELPLLSEDNEVKRKRGRPRKIVLHATIKPLTPKGPRGRPRIKPLLPEPEPVEEEKSSESNTDEDDDNNDKDNDNSDISDEFEEK